MAELFQRAKTKLVEKTSPKIEAFRSQTLDRIDNKVQDLENPDQPHRLSETQREKLVRTLNGLRLKIEKQEIDEATGESGETGEPTTEEAQEIVSISEELMAQIREDRCPICLKSLNPQETKQKTSIQVSICPSCGHGGHQKHFEPWIKDKGTCPFCKTTLKTNDLLGLIIE